MALPKDMRLKGHRTFNYIHKNCTKYHGQLMTIKVAKSNPKILISHKFKYKSNNLRFAFAISKKVSKKAVERNKVDSFVFKKKKFLGEAQKVSGLHQAFPYKHCW